jgi:RNA polymerase sigma-70 factor (ECF subfamily)
MWFLAFDTGCATMVDKTSASLLERVRQLGDQEAWTRFVHLYTPLLFLWAKRLKLDLPEAEELVQEVFSALVNQLPEFRYDPARRFRGWLWTVTLNKVRERRRKKTLIHAGPLDGEVIDEANGVAEFTDAEYRQYITERAFQLIQQDFEPGTRRAFLEHVMRGRTAADVAAELGMSIGAVYAAKTRVLARLRIELQGLVD